MAPHIVCESLKELSFAAGLFSAAGFKTYPSVDEIREISCRRFDFGDRISLFVFVSRFNRHTCRQLRTA